MRRLASFFRILPLFGLALLCPVPAQPAPPEGKNESEAAARVPVSLGMEAGTEGYAADLGLTAGMTLFRFGLSAVPGRGPEARFGLRGPLLVAGPARSGGILRFLRDPGADGYLFSGTWRRPLALDMDSGRTGVCMGDAAGAWFLEAEAPSMGLWAGTPGEAGPIAGLAAAGSLLPRSRGYDAWFSGEDARPGRLAAAGAAWAGYGFSGGRILAAAAYSEEDLGGRGWAARGEAEYRRREFRWSARFSFASPGWRGLDGEKADLWEARADISGFVPPGIRLESRCRAGRTGQGDADWEGMVRATWVGRPWRFQAGLGGSDSDSEPPLRLEPNLRVEYEARALRLAADAGCRVEGKGLARAEVSASLGVGKARSFRLSLEAARRWTAEEGCWKARARAELPCPAGEFHVTLGTEDWTPGSGGPGTVLEFGLRARIR